jgi:Na+-transporting methylmalonyl-CoA/oxaloacetate decarboxylase gamma subunit
VKLAVIVLGAALVVLLLAIIIAAIRQIDAGGRH